MFVDTFSNGSLIPTPWNLFVWDPQLKRLAFTGDLGSLDGAPSFNSQDKINLGDPTWDDAVEDFWR